MNNVKKAFKNKAACGLRMSAGGIIDPTLVNMDAIRAGTVDPNGSDYDTINAEKTLRWAKEDGATALSQGQTFTPTMAASDLANGLEALDAKRNKDMLEQHVGVMPTMRKSYVAPRNYAAGGVIDPVEALLARTKAKYGGVAAQPAPQPAPQPTPAPQPAPVQAQPQGLRAYGSGMNLDARMKAAGLAQGGIVRGKGGPTDDEVPMRVGGVDVNLSNKEAVLPAKTVQALGGPEAVEDLIETTNGKPVVKTGLRAGGDYSTGVVGDMIDPRELRPEFRSQAQTPVIEPAANAGLEAARNGRAAAAIQAMPNVPNSGPQPLPAAPAAPVAEAAPAAVPRSVQLGRQVGGALNKLDLRGASGTLLGGAAMVGSEMLNNDQNELLNDPNVSNWDKARQVARSGIRSAGTLAGGTIAGTAGTVAGSPVLGVPAAIAGGYAGNRAGDWVGEKLVGDPIAERKASASAKRHATHNEIMGGKDSGTFELPISAADKAAAKTATPKAVAQAEPASPLGVQIQEGNGLRSMLESGGVDSTVARTVAGAVQGSNDKRADFNGTKDATDYTVPEGMGGGVITRAPGKNGLRQTTVIGGPSAADAARDAQFAAEGRAKDAYGNWVDPKTAAMKNEIAAIRRDRAERDAFGDTTDPEAREAGLRAVAMYENRDNKANELAVKRADLGLRQAQFQHELQKTNNLQNNADREFNDKRAAARQSVLNDWLDNNSKVVDKDGKAAIDPARRAALADAMANVGGGAIPKDPDELQKHLTTYGTQAKLTGAMNAAVKNRGGITDFRNWGVRGKTTDKAVTPKIVGKTLLGDELVDLGGFQVPLREIVGDDADLLAEFKRRLAGKTN